MLSSSTYDLNTPTSYVTLGTLGGTLVNKLVKGNQGSSKRLRDVHNLEVAILAVASGQYVVTLPMDVKRTQRWRFFDWLVTTPMLLRTFYLLAEEKGFRGSYLTALGADILMIFAGYFAEHPEQAPKLGTENDQNVWYVIGMVALAVILQQINSWNQHLLNEGVDTGNIPTIFYLGWLAYGVTFMVPTDDIRQTAFNILDLFNKGVYSWELDRVIRNNF